MLEKIDKYINDKDVDSLYFNCLVDIKDISEIPRLNETQYQYICAAFLKRSEHVFFLGVVKVALEFFPNSISILNLKSIYFYRIGEYQACRNILEDIIDLAQEKGVSYSKFLQKIDKVKKKLKVKDKLEELKKTIYSNDSLLLNYDFRNRSDILFITFWGAPQSKLNTIDEWRKTPGYAESFILNNGYDLVSVIKKDYGFYQDLDRELLQSLLVDLIDKYKKVYMYGGSGGGYAALYYSIGLNVIPIAFSPRIRIDPITGMKLDENHPDMNHELLSLCSFYNKAYVFYDPKYKPDYLYINNRVKPCFKNAIITELPFSGHGAFMLGELGIVKNLINGIVHNDRVDIDFNLRKNSVIYHYHLAVHLFKAGKLNSGIIVSVRGIELSSHRKLKFDKVNIYNLLIKNLLLSNKKDCAIKLHLKYRTEPWFSDFKNKYLDF